MLKIIQELFSKNITILQAILVFMVIMIFVPVFSKFASGGLTNLIKRYAAYLKYVYARSCSPTILQQITLKEYFKRITNSYLFKVSIPTYEDYITKNLNDVFIPLNLSNTKLGVSQNITGDKLRKTDQYTFIIGEPGSGKTTLVKSILLDMIENSMSKGKIDKMPVFISLKDIQINIENDNNELIETYIINNLQSFKIPSLVDIYKTARAGFGCVFVFDGLDEIARQTYNQLERRLMTFIKDTRKSSEKNEIYLTAREQLYKSDIIDREEIYTLFPQIAFVNPFTDEEIYQFLRKWHDYKEGQSSSQLFAELIFRPHVLDLCRNPLLLSILTSQYSNKAYFEIPESRGSFYNVISKELLYRRRSFKDSIRTNKFIVEERSSFLKLISYNNLFSQNPRNSFSKSDLFEAIAGNKGEKENFLDRLCVDTGVLKKESSERYTFMHLSFEEFYAAEYIGEKKSWSFLFNRYLHLDERLEEIITFFIGQTKSEEITFTILNDLFKSKKIDLLIKCFLERKYYKNAIFEQLIDLILEDSIKILKPENNIRNSTFINFLSIIFNSKEIIGKFPKGFEQKLIDLVRNDERYLVNILHLVGKYDPNIMLSIYKVIGEKHLNQLIVVLKLLVSDDRIVDNIIAWYTGSESFIPKDDLVLILLHGMKYPSTRKTLSDNNLPGNNRKIKPMFILPNYHENKALTLMFNLGLSICDKRGKLEDSEEINFAIHVRKDKPLLKQWNSFFNGSNNVTKEQMDGIKDLTRNDIIVTLSSSRLFPILVFFSIFVAAPSVLEHFYIHKLIPVPIKPTIFSFFPSVVLLPIEIFSLIGIVIYVYGNFRLTMQKKRRRWYYFNLNNAMFSDLLSFYFGSFLMVKFIKKTIPNYSMFKSKALFKNLKKVDVGNCLSNLWFFDV